MSRNNSNIQTSIFNTKPTSTPISFLNKFKTTNNESKVKYIIICILVILLLAILLYIGIAYYNYSNITCYEKKDFWDYIIDFSNPEICIRKTAPPPPKKPSVPLLSIIEDRKEVFHIANQDYTYDQAKCKCESYGARLATKEDITDAYNNGANWCTYGWSEKQSAFYPVQKCDWDKMKSENERLPENKRRFCGLPGLNGGFFANPQIKFGVNCYGVKPKGSIVQAKQPYCPPMNFCKLESNYEASHKLDTDEVVGFNNDKWNMNI